MSHTQSKTEIRQGDRIVIFNVPQDQFEHLYKQRDTGDFEGIIQKNFFEESEGDILHAQRIGFFTGYFPFKDGNEFSLSGSGYSIDRNKLKFVGRQPATFWKWADRPRAGGGMNYTEEVNWFQCDYNDLT